MTTTQNVPATAGAPTPAIRNLALSGLLVAEAMNLLDSTITTVVTPTIAAGLGGSRAALQWIPDAYTLPFAVLLILGGRLGDMVGRRRLALGGLVGFVLASLVCAAAPTTAVLIVARVVQGAAAAMIIPQTIGLIRATFTGPALPRALSLIGPVMGLTAVAGPVLGGVLTRADIAGLSWRAVFCVNLPLGVYALLTARLLREDRAERRPTLDVTGLLLAAAGTALLVVPVIEGQAHHWPWTTWPELAVGVLLCGVFVAHLRRREAAGRHAIVEPSLFADRGFPAALAASLGYFAVSVGVLFVVVLHLEVALRLSTSETSLAILPFPAGLAVASLLGGRFLLARVGDRLMLIGLGVLAVVTAGLVVALGNDPRPGSYPVVLSVMLGVAGLGGGLFTVPFFTAALARTRPQETGSAAGLLNAVQQLAGTVGVAGLGAVYLSAAADSARTAAVVTAVVALAVVVVTVPAAAVLVRSGARDRVR